LEKKLQRKQALPLPTFHKYIRGVEEFFDGISLTNNPTAYLKSLKIKKVEV